MLGPYQNPRRQRPRAAERNKNSSQGETTMTMRSMLLATAAVMATTSFASAADQQLSGSITGATGQKLDGVVVSAKKEGSTITTSVYTDAQGDYYFPAMPEGKYNVWAQALGFEQNKVSVDLNANKRQNLQLKTI